MMVWRGLIFCYQKNADCLRGSYADAASQSPVTGGLEPCLPHARNVKLNDYVAKPLRGEIITCPDCGAELEVVSENPLQLEFAPQEEEDWGE